MSNLVATGATVLAVAFAVGSVAALLAGNHFLSGTLLTFVAFAIYFRESNTE
ncbi:hypothetical protein [Natronobacterium gregoryi]|uniref:Uncharacterized protein n=2 Tax=Natronobacterium gregoryi TaxID=44930 RepID=L0ALX1_NATGS|nr:hypothetical protein [Natronobacterium gregoryi]AFZ74050.1 hypothetical protein Natgr_2912 [Natronobacterium gregoryi SP2]SFJ06783.1 hypothetical protein SAMN05443661_11330 [Natronobacterium gregoryi]